MVGARRGWIRLLGHLHGSELGPHRRWPHLPGEQGGGEQGASPWPRRARGPPHGIPGPLLCQLAAPVMLNRWPGSQGGDSPRSRKLPGPASSICSSERSFEIDLPRASPRASGADQGSWCRAGLTHRGVLKSVVLIVVPAGRCSPRSAAAASQVSPTPTRVRGSGPMHKPDRQQVRSRAGAFADPVS